ncbi:DUF3196 family protein [Spiroplasma endosymbiont of Panorpa germanica]|uniref:DUF3196 family protein n=1 Tax=Spiroplasma endosymbiont of Panorpa germanica TaxID=3066314 RepID=UPI0030D47852
MNNDFYPQTILEIKELLDAKKYQEAQSIIDQELGMPYLPIEFEEQLLQLRLELLRNGREQNQKSWNLDSIKIMLASADANIQLNAIEALKGFNVRNLLLELKNMLSSDIVCDENKVCILFILAEQQVDEDFKVFKKNGWHNFNPTKMDLREYLKKLEIIKHRLEELVYNDNPSLFGVCEFILNSYFYAAFPNFDEQDIDVIVGAIWYKASVAQGMEIGYNNIKEIMKIEEKKFIKAVDLINSYNII